MNRTRVRYLTAVSALVLGAFLIRASSLDAQSLWRDEVDALRFATAPWAEMLGNFTRHGWNGPLYYVLLRGWIALAGTSEYAMRFFSLVPGILSIPLIYVMGRRLYTPLTGLIAALLVTGSPYLVWYSQEVKMYTLVMALSLIAIYSLRRGLEGGGWAWWLTQVIATTLALYTHILAALLIPVQIMIGVVWWSLVRNRWRSALVSFVILTLPYLPLVTWQAPLALQPRDTGFTSYSLSQMVVILINAWSTGIAGWGRSWGAALMSLLAVGGLLSQISRWLRTRESVENPRSDGARHWIALLVWLLTPLLAIWVVSRWQPLFTDRYLIWSAPAFYLLVALALSVLIRHRTWSRRGALVLLTALLAFQGANDWEQATTTIKSNFRAAAAYVASYEASPEPVERAPSAPMPEPGQAFRHYLPLVAARGARFGDLIIFQIPYGRYSFDYYFPIERYPWAEGLYTNHRVPNGEYQMSEYEAAWQMQELTEGHREIWLIATEVSLWDERNLVQSWLEEHLELVAEAHFARVDVYRYTLPDG